MKDQVLAIKDKDGFYYTTYAGWNKQLRKAKFYHSYKYAKDVVDAFKSFEKKVFIINVDIIEGGVVDYV